MYLSAPTRSLFVFSVRLRSFLANRSYVTTRNLDRARTHSGAAVPDHWLNRRCGFVRITARSGAAHNHEETLDASSTFKGYKGYIVPPPLFFLPLLRVRLTETPFPRWFSRKHSQHRTFLFRTGRYMPFNSTLLRLNSAITKRRRELPSMWPGSEQRRYNLRGTSWRASFIKIAIRPASWYGQRREYYREAYPHGLWCSRPRPCRRDHPRCSRPCAVCGTTPLLK